jgi:hypothetical protein
MALVEHGEGCDSCNEDKMMKDNTIEQLNSSTLYVETPDACNGSYLNENAELFMCIPAIQTQRS